MPEGSTHFDENDYIYITFMSNFGGEIKFKADFPKRERGPTNGENADEVAINIHSQNVSAVAAVDEEEIEKELHAYHEEN